MKKIQLFSALVLITCFALNSCIKQNYDTPANASQIDPHLTCNTTISQISLLAYQMSVPYRVLGDTTIYGVVTADDRSGNFYKQIVIQDSTGGITLCLDGTNLFNSYPINRKIYINLKGLLLINYKGLPEIGFSTYASGTGFKVNGLPYSLFKNYITPATFPDTSIKVPHVRMTDLATNVAKYVNTLVTIDSVEFDSVFTKTPTPYSNAFIGTNVTIYDCPYTGSLVMYNSNYATFQPAIIPSGRGNLTCIYSVYNTSQILLRDTSDIKCTAPRLCP